MKKHIKIILAFLLGIAVSGIGAYAVNEITASQIDYTKKDGTEIKVDAALNDLYDKANSQAGYAAMFNGVSSMTTSFKAVPNTYIDSNYGYVDNNGDLIITSAGDYQIIAKAGHSWNGYTTIIYIYLNDELIPNPAYSDYSAWSNRDEDKILNKVVSIPANAKINVKMKDDGNPNGTAYAASSLVVLIKK